MKMRAWSTIVLGTCRMIDSGKLDRHGAPIFRPETRTVSRGETFEMADEAEAAELLRSGAALMVDDPHNAQRFAPTDPDPFSMV